MGDSPAGFSLLQTIEKRCAEHVDEWENTALVMMSDSLFESHKKGFVYDEKSHRIVQERIGIISEEVLVLFQHAPRVEWTRKDAFEYQQRLRGIGLMTLGYEHTTELLAKLQLAEAETQIPDWQPNPGRTSCLSVWDIDVGGTVLRGKDVFVSGFVLPTSDVEGPFVAGSLGGGKEDQMGATKHGRSGDSECRALVHAYRSIQEVQEMSPELVHICGTVSLHVSGVPCLSCVGVMAQFKLRYPKVRMGVTFELREQPSDTLESTTDEVLQTKLKSPSLQEERIECTDTVGVSEKRKQLTEARQVGNGRWSYY